MMIMFSKFSESSSQNPNISVIWFQSCLLHGLKLDPHSLPFYFYKQTENILWIPHEQVVSIDVKSFQSLSESFILLQLLN